MHFSFLIGAYFFITATTPLPLLRFDLEWFTNESFFNEEVIRDQKIKAIHIWVSEKKDGKIFEKEHSFLHYVFNKNGAILKSYKEVPMKGKTDTLFHQYFYDSNNLCVKKIERLQPYHFIYHFSNENGKNTSEIKIDAHTKDTSYHHQFKHKITDERHIVSVYNGSNKAYKFISTEYDKAGNIINKRKTFKRNRSYTESAYNFQDGLLQKIATTRFYGKKKINNSFLNYEDQMLQHMTVKENGKIKYKLGFTYDSKGLVDAIIKRNPEKKTVTIYRLEYLYFD